MDQNVYSSFENISTFLKEHSKPTPPFRPFHNSIVTIPILVSRNNFKIQIETLLCIQRADIYTRQQRLLGRDLSLIITVKVVENCHESKLSEEERRLILERIQNFGIDLESVYFLDDDREYYESFQLFIVSTLRRRNLIKQEPSYVCNVPFQRNTLVKFYLRSVTLPSLLQPYRDRPIYLAVTFGKAVELFKTLYIILGGPNYMYGMYETVENELIICNQETIRQLSYQQYTPEKGIYKCIQELKGSDLVDSIVFSPLLPYDVPVVTGVNFSYGSGFYYQPGLKDESVLEKFYGDTLSIMKSKTNNFKPSKTLFDTYILPHYLEKVEKRPIVVNDGNVVIELDTLMISQANHLLKSKLKENVKDEKQMELLITESFETAIVKKGLAIPIAYNQYNDDPVRIEDRWKVTFSDKQWKNRVLLQTVK